MTGCCWIPAPTSTSCWCAGRSASPPEVAYYLCHTRHPVSLAELVRVAGSRWGVEETFQFAKNKTGLDHYQVRKYDAWYRHITLSMLAAAFLAVTARAERARDEKGTNGQIDDLVPLSCNEIRRLWATLTHPAHTTAHTDHWSDWRRRHQTRARHSHYQRQRAKRPRLRCRTSSSTRGTCGPTRS